MNIPINFLITIFPRQEITFRQLSLVIGIILFMFIPFYLIGQSVANMDRQAGIATAKLPKWARRILFFRQPSPFRKRTIFFQTYVVLGLFTILVMVFIVTNATVITTTLRWYYRILLPLILICDLRLRRTVKSPSDSE